MALALGVQVIENNLLVPKIQAGFLGLHPTITIIVLVVGSAVAELGNVVGSAANSDRGPGLALRAHRVERGGRPPGREPAADATT